MVRRVCFSALLFSVTVAALLPTPALADDADVHRTGTYYARAYTRWGLGASPSPLLGAIEGTTCGEVYEGRFFMVPPPILGLDLRCRVPHGSPIVFSHAGAFTFIPHDGDTDAEIIAEADALFAPVISWARLDGEPVEIEDMTRNVGAITVRSEPGSFYDVAIGVGTGPIRTALTGSFMTIEDLPCGRHRLRTRVDFGVPGARFGGTWRIRVRGCGND